MNYRTLFVFIFIILQTATSIAQIPFQSLDVFDLQWVDNPEISPNGKQIVYQRRGMDIMTDLRTSSLWLIDTDGTNHQKLSNFSSSESSVKWSPEGGKIAFVTAKGIHGVEIFIIG